MLYYLLPGLIPQGDNWHLFHVVYNEIIKQPPVLVLAPEDLEALYFFEIQFAISPQLWNVDYNIGWHFTAEGKLRPKSRKSKLSHYYIPSRRKGFQGLTRKSKTGTLRADFSMNRGHKPGRLWRHCSNRTRLSRAAPILSRKDALDDLWILSHWFPGTFAKLFQWMSTKRVYTLL